MSWMARSAPEEATEEDAKVQTAMLWLLESYDVTAVPRGAQTGLAPWRADVPATPTDGSAPSMRAVAVLERAVDVDADVDVPTDLGIEVVTTSAMDAVPPIFLVEKRLERRLDCAMAVAAASASGTAETALGETVNISVSGVHLVMDRAAIVGPIELIVGDTVVNARVVDHRELDDGRHAWHVHVLDNDDAWFALVAAADR